MEYRNLGRTGLKVSALWLGMAGMSIAWVAAHPLVTAPIIGVHTLDHLEQALRSQEIKLTVEEREEIARLAVASSQ